MSHFLDSVVILAIVLILARFIKRGSKLLQHFFIPSALVAGFGGLILGPQLLGTVNADITAVWATFPKYLITVVFAGLFLGKHIPSRKELWNRAGPMLAFGNTVAWGQYVIGSFLALFILVPVFNASPLSGALIEIGFEGGHGTSAGLAPSFEKLGWSAGTDIALTLATISLLCAIASGIILINWRNRYRGYMMDEEAWKKQRSILVRSGYNLVRFGEKISTSPKIILFNLIAFAAAIGLGILLFESLVWMESTLLNSWTDLRFMPYVPLFPFAMMGGLMLQFFLRKMKWQHLIQRRTAQIISTIALDLLIASAVATISLRAVADNLPVIIILSVAGVAWILCCFFVLAPRMFTKHWYEYGLTNTGQSMGMTATGLLMNRLADPSNQTSAKEGFAYKQLAFEPFMGGGIVTAMSLAIIADFGLVFTLVTSAVCMLFWLIVGLILGKKRRTEP